MVVCIILATSLLIQTISKKESSLLRSHSHTNTAISAKGDWAKLEIILNNVVAKYVDSLDQKQITEKILPVVMSELDPHSVYLPPEELNEADESLSGEFFGIGIMFTVPEDTAIVNNVIVGGPSEKAGIQPGDRIVAVDDSTIAGVKMPQNDMVKRMRGKKGTKVKISLLREGEKVDVDIVRDKISEKSVDVCFMVDGTTGYLKLSKFARTSYDEFMKGVKELKKQGMTRLIFDLRQNTGGYMDQAILLANEFLPKGKLVVYVEGAHYKREDIFATGSGRLQDIDLAVLIDESSASSSEIFAGAIQDNDRGTIYGLRSFGKGLVQEPLYFSDGSGIRLTVGRYHTPTGRCIQKPYRDDYAFDIYERYQSGEMLSVDSIKVNDSLKFVTEGGRIVYGGGGIIPDVFVPIDTTGYTEFLGKCNRKSLQFKYAYQLCDSRRKEINSIKNMASLNAFLATIDIKNDFIAFAKKNEIAIKPGEWEISGGIITTQIKAMIARYTPLDEEGFYPIWLTIDNTFRKAYGKQAQ